MSSSYFLLLRQRLFWFFGERQQHPGVSWTCWSFLVCDNCHLLSDRVGCEYVSVSDPLQDSSRNGSIWLKCYIFGHHFNSDLLHFYIIVCRVWVLDFNLEILVKFSQTCIFTLLNPSSEQLHSDSFLILKPDPDPEYPVSCPHLFVFLLM